MSATPGHMLPEELVNRVGRRRFLSEQPTILLGGSNRGVGLKQKSSSERPPETAVGKGERLPAMRMAGSSLLPISPSSNTDAAPRDTQPTPTLGAAAIAPPVRRFRLGFRFPSFRALLARLSVVVALLKILFLPLSGLWSLRKRFLLGMTFLYLLFTWIGGIAGHVASIAACTGIDLSEITIPPLANALKDALKSMGNRSRFGRSRKDVTILTEGAYVFPELTSLDPRKLSSWWANPNVETVKPDAVLDGRASCWPFEGNRGYITIQLTANVSVAQVMISHPLGGNPRSAPKDVVVWGIHHAQELPTVDLPHDHELPQALMEELISLRLVPVPLTKFRYDINARERSQVIEVVGNEKGKVEKVLFQVLSNWGEYFTCIYCLRVYGH
ncbi:hypothetical protein BJ322DRAFT_1023626 [Thelephora terrestris]|uniref:SUN domain-containing protein n=1 Tax=Thelephora terrestris TaxID=56493 RepID=A0A9P6HA78_9AGAM|nr:hypothetical protein BJ322DRAFT_1023626 [Thelephora terrestris]